MYNWIVCILSVVIPKHNLNLSWILFLIFYHHQKLVIRTQSANTPSIDLTSLTLFAQSKIGYALNCCRPPGLPLKDRLDAVLNFTEQMLLFKLLNIVIGALRYYSELINCNPTKQMHLFVTDHGISMNHNNKAIVALFVCTTAYCSIVLLWPEKLYFSLQVSWMCNAGSG